MCNPGCHCDEGYVKTNDGRCVKPEQCSSRTETKSCLEEPDEGLCRGYFESYYYDYKSRSCKTFIYGGCGGNGNRYATEEECMDQCGDVVVFDSDESVCELPVEKGMCLGYFPRYHFDKETGTCKKFIYGGCQGNGNNFRTAKECRERCGASSQQSNVGTCDLEPETGLCRGYFPRFYFDRTTGTCKRFIYGGCGGNLNNFNTVEECQETCTASAPTACDQEKEVGLCKAYIPRYFFNKETGRCERFIYGGCGGNSNNFNSEEDCQAVCLGA
jgi:hypothetical protein